MRNHELFKHLEVHSPDIPRAPVVLSIRQQQIIDLLLQGCANAEIAEVLKLKLRTVKAHFNRLFLRFGISGGVKRVKLAALLYRSQLNLETSTADSVSPTNESSRPSHPLIDHQ
jgi:DNA-binding NarL/FixJ family response regulator